jgi:hypothetical protein
MLRLELSQPGKTLLPITKQEIEETMDFILKREHRKDMVGPCLRREYIKCVHDHHLEHYFTHHCRTIVNRLPLNGQSYLFLFFIQISEPGIETIKTALPFRWVFSLQSGAISRANARAYGYVHS